MIPHGFAAQPIPSTTTLASAEELTDGLDAPSGEPTEPATRSGAEPYPVGSCLAAVGRFASSCSRRLSARGTWRLRASSPRIS